jgi:hypothetical protein
MADRPTLALDDDPRAVEEFVAGLQAAVDARDADGLNRQLADDVLWGEPLWSGRQRIRQDPRHPLPNACCGERATSSRPRWWLALRDRARAAGRRGHGDRLRATVLARRARRARRGAARPGGRTSLPCSCSSSGTEPGGSPPDSMLPTGTMSIGDGAQATRQDAVAPRDGRPALGVLVDIERGFWPSGYQNEGCMTTTGS